MERRAFITGLMALATLTPNLTVNAMTNDIKHIVLAGDSIFDNDGYVPGEPGVIEQLRMSVPKDWSAAKIAVDGDCIRHVYSRVENLPTHYTDMVLSIGGNDALGYSTIIDEMDSIEDLPRLAARPMTEFRKDYQTLLDHLIALDVKLSVCTIYTAVPFDNAEWREYVPIALNLFNSIIKEEAQKRNIDVIDIDKVCTEPADFAAVSPIEPSAIGGQKIVDLIIEHLSV